MKKKPDWKFIGACVFVVAMLALSVFAATLQLMAWWRIAFGNSK